MSVRRGQVWLMLALVSLGTGMTTFAHDAQERTALPAPDLETVLGTGTASGYARADHPRTFRFPHDFGPHRAFKTEWWYFTGNLDSAHGQRFGYELTLFRFSLSPHAIQSPSRWSTNQVYVAHFAVTDPAGKRFRFFQQEARAAIGLAGTQAAPFRVWVYNWGVGASAGTEWPWHLHADAKNVSLNLNLTPLLAPVLQGSHGLSRKGLAPGNASYYYSIPRLETRGTLSLNGRSFAVKGLSWLDREWSTSALAPDEAGWDWFGLQLSDGSDLMFYRLRRKNGATDPLSQGSLVDRRGKVMRLTTADVRIQVLKHWLSPLGGTYPARWRLFIKSEHLTLDVTPILADQELDVGVRYWEGAVDVHGYYAGHLIRGEGYVELTGYAPTSRVQPPRQ